MFQYVYNFFHSNDLFYKYQAGFFVVWAFHCISTLIETYDCIVKAIDGGKYCCMAYCNLSKAFDRVWHKGLNFKLKSDGNSGIY